MNCPSCNAELRDTTKYCPYCGRQAFRRASAQATAILQNHAAAATAPLHREMQATAALPIDSWPLPKRYAAKLGSGTSPEEIIWELVRHHVKMRKVLEGLVEKSPGEVSPRVAAAITEYLQSHCVACGQQTEMFKKGRTPICNECADE